MRRSRKAFTLVELLVVISIIGMLMALLLPAVQNARESGRRAVCLNNIRNLGLAVASYESQRRSYPGYRDSLTINSNLTVNGVTTNKVPVNWLIPLLPNLERPDLNRLWKGMTNCVPAGSGSPPAVTYTFAAASPLVYMELLVCPSDPQSPQPTGSPQPMSYVVNCGLQDVPATQTYPGDWDANGVFVSRWEVPQSSGGQLLTLATNADGISRGDGVSSTLLLSENMEARYYSDCFQYVAPAGTYGSLTNPVSEQMIGFIWTPQYPLPTTVQQMRCNGLPAAANSTTIGLNPSPGIANDVTYARPSSAHPGGANFVYADVHTKFLSENVDYLVFTLLMTSFGTSARTPGTGAAFANQMFNITPLDEGQVF